MQGHSFGFRFNSVTAPPSAKALRVEPISGTDANRIIREIHYSGKVVPNSQIHLGVFWNGRCGGAMQFGPSLRRDLMRNLVKGTQPKECIELNRLAFADWLPRNSESRCLSVALRMLKKNYQHLKWVVSFADACQCGDGTIYRATGFLLVAVNKNRHIRINPRTGERQTMTRAYHDKRILEFKHWKMVEGFQVQYVYFLKPEERKNLTCDVLPYDTIAKMGASMYRGRRRSCGETSVDQAEEGGSIPTPTLQPGE